MTTRKPVRLGRGLSALLGDAAPDAMADAPMTGATGTTAPQGLRQLPIEALEPGPFQPRGAMNDESLMELAASIREHGMLQPIIVRPRPNLPGRYQIVGGERRWRAAQLVPLHEVPVVLRDFTDGEAMAAGLVENLQRENLNPMEEAEGYRRLSEEFGFTQDLLGRAVGKSRTHITNTMRLLTLPQSVQKLLQEGALSAGHARALLGAKNPGYLAQIVAERGLNVRQTEILAGIKARGKEAAEKQKRDADLIALERRIMERLGLKVTIAHRGQRGSVMIQYRDLDQLDGIIRLLMPS